MNYFEKKDVGKKIRDIREGYNLSEGDFAKIHNVTAKDVKKWEKGVCLPNAKKLEKILHYNYAKQISNGISKEKKKATKKVDRPKAHLITDDQLKAIKQSASEEAFNKIFEVLLAIPLQALIEEGYGKKRLGRCLDKMIDILEDIQNGKVDVADLKSNIKIKYGLETTVYEADNDIKIKRIS